MDKQLFAGAAKFYSKYRLNYPPEFFEKLCSFFALDKTKRVLDLGAGTGQITIPLAQYVQEVVAVDPDSEMIDEGKVQAENNEVNNIQWINQRAEDISNDLGLFALTTMGASFHWMDQDDVIQKVYNLTDNNGGIAIGAINSTIVNNVNHDAWKDVTWTTIKEFLGEDRRAGNGLYNKPKDKFEDVIARSKFGRIEIYRYSWTVERSIDDIFGYLASTSFAAPRLFGSRYDEFKNLLTQRLLDLNPIGKYIENASLEMIFARKA